MINRIRDLSYVVLLCDELTTMAQFYTEIMQFEVYAKHSQRIELRVGSTILALVPQEGNAHGEGGRGASVQLAFRVAPDDVRDIEAYLVDHDVEIVVPTTDTDYGQRKLQFRDPEGNELQIYADISLPKNDTLLSKLTFEQVLEISEHCELLTYEVGENIVNQGDLAERFFVITKGHVKVVNTTDDGRELLIGYLHTGDYFGEVGLLQSHPRTATIRADDTVHVIAIDRQGFSELLEESDVANADISQAMYERLMGMAETIIQNTKR